MMFGKDFDLEDEWVEHAFRCGFIVNTDAYFARKRFKQEQILAAKNKFEETSAGLNFTVDEQGRYLSPSTSLAWTLWQQNREADA